MYIIFTINEKTGFSTLNDSQMITDNFDLVLEVMNFTRDHEDTWLWAII